MTLFTARAKRRVLELWKERAEAAWQKLSQRFLNAWAAELDGHGTPHDTLRWQLFAARARFYIQRCAAALAALIVST
jgi:hypothetical protein